MYRPMQVWNKICFTSSYTQSINDSEVQYGNNIDTFW